MHFEDKVGCKAAGVLWRDGRISGRWCFIEVKQDGRQLVRCPCRCIFLGLREGRFLLDVIQGWPLSRAALVCSQ